jgi:YesN/AraC family two-component response regulator
MNENINFFSLADVKRQMGIDDGLNDNVMIYDFNVENNIVAKAKTPSRIDAVGIVVCLKGRISININAQEFELSAGMAALVLPNCTYSVNVCTCPSQGTLFVMSKELLKNTHVDLKQIVPIGMHMFHNPCFHLSEREIDLYNHYLDMIRLVSNREDNHSAELILGIARSLMVFIHEVMEHEAGNDKNLKNERINNRNMRLFEEFMHLLTENFRSEHQIGFYADKLCLTPKYLSLLIKQTSGRSVSDWIDYCLIMEAKSLLRFSDMSIQQVAYSLHFPTPSFFGTYFKRHTGLTPGEYRQEG